MSRMTAALLLGAIALAAPAAAQPPSAASPAAAQKPKSYSQCFRSQDFQGFHAINDHSFYMRARINDFYRIDMEGTCPELTFPDARLITVVRGPDEICGPLDWDLKVAENPPSIAVGCIVKSQTRLTPEQAAAIPPKLKP